MPYIPAKQREKLDPFIEQLTSLLGKAPNNDVLSGELNYTFYRLALLLCDDTHSNSVGKRNYSRMAVVSSALGEAQTEFRRRILAPYEKKKKESAGDVSTRM